MDLVNVSDISTYAFCPRLLYFRLKFGEDRITEMHAVREIYLSMRKGFDVEWAFERFKRLYDAQEVFEKAYKKFKYNSILNEFQPVEWEIKLESNKLRLKGVLDEIVSFRGKKLPLILALKGVRGGASGNKKVWFRDLVKVAAFCMLLEVNEGLVYYCFDGELERVEITRREKYQVLKLIERVLRVKKGFVPEKRKKSCEKCWYLEVCNSQPSTFASKFL